MGPIVEYIPIIARLLFIFCVIFLVNFFLVFMADYTEKDHANRTVDVDTDSKPRIFEHTNSFRNRMHPKNPYQTEPDFYALSQNYPSLQKYVFKVLRMAELEELFLSFNILKPLCFRTHISC